MHRRSATRLATAVLVVFLGACQAPASTGATCTRDAECAAPLTCSYGRCHEQCHVARDCPLESRCILGASGPVCALDPESHCDGALCPSPLVCAQDQCRTECRVDADCLAGSCTGGTCAEPVRTGDLAPVARLVSSAHFTDWYGPAYGTHGMSRAGFAIETAGVRDGELLLLIGCVDNGSSTAWPSPLAPGFTQLGQDTWGSDQQTCVVAWRIAAAEPESYAGSYGPGIVSGSSVLALVAVSGARSVNPIATYALVAPAQADTDPVDATSSGLVTTGSDTAIVFAASADWTCPVAHGVSSTLPAGFTSLLHEGDHGDDTCDWTWLQIATASQHAAGPTGPLSSTERGTPACTGSAWTAAIAIER